MHQKNLKTFFSLFLTFTLCLCFLDGCNKSKLPAKTGEIEYTIVTGSDIPKELKQLIKERKENPFELTFSDNAYLYLIKGYGKQKSGGYSIKINQLYEAKDTLVFDTDLIGPKVKEQVSETPSYPYIVLKAKFRELPVTFY